MAVVAQCPGCGSQQEFRTGAPVKICDHCSSVLARKDREVSSLGKVVDLAVTQSPLELNLDGRWRGAPFTLIGRAQIQHPKGGVWDEWYLAFEDGRWGWLAEAQGRFTLTFEAPLPSSGRLPGPGELKPGKRVPLEGGPWQVIERNTGQRKGAAGEIPYPLVPGETFAFVDLSGPDGAFATLDFGDGKQAPAFYAGREVDLAELGWGDRRPTDRAAPAVQVEQLQCPHCGGALELRCPQSERVACPYCGGFSDVRGTHLEKLALATHNKKINRPIPLGATGTFDGKPFEVIAFLQRSTQVEGIRYPWQEFLLYHRQLGFRWLMFSDDHWTLIENVPPAAVNERGSHAVHKKKTFRCFQRGVARVDHVEGEVYWKVTPGEQVRFADYVAPPLSLSQEIDDDEQVWSIGRYLTRQEVAAAFGKPPSSFPAPSKVGPSQPYTHDTLFVPWLILVAAVIALGVLVALPRTPAVVYSASASFEPLATNTPQVWFSESFPLDDRHNVEVMVAAEPLNNSWAYVEGDLVDEASGWVQDFATELSFYSGVSGGERWSEGQRSTREYFSAPPAGTYALRLEVQRQNLTLPLSVTVRVRQGVPRWPFFFWVLGGISVLPVVMLIHRGSFESRRWAESTEVSKGDDG